MNPLIENLLLFDSLNEQQISLISRMTRLVHLSEGTYFAEPGNTLFQLAFVNSGLLRYHYYNSKAENITHSLIGEGNFVAASYLQLPVIPSEYLQAITECTLSVIEKSGMEELSATVLNWDNIVRKISQKAVAERSKRFLWPIDNTDPEATARRYLKKFPEVSKHLSANQLLHYVNAKVDDQEFTR